MTNKNIKFYVEKCDYTYMICYGSFMVFKIPPTIKNRKMIANIVVKLLNKYLLAQVIPKYNLRYLDKI